MVKKFSKYVCQQCGYETSKWHGKCLDCGQWGSLVETIVSSDRRTRPGGGKKTGQVTKTTPLSSVPSRKTRRISTKISELDRVLGGGIVPGQVILIAGEPGIGKSTILLQLSEKLGKTLYVSGEESIGQVALRGQRLGVKNKTIHFLEETDVDNIINTAELFSSELAVKRRDRKSTKRPDSIYAGKAGLSAVIIDSIQTMFTPNLSGMAGSVGQVRECAYRLVRFAKRNSIPIFIVGHVTKIGTVAGPAVLAHLVDTVLWFEGEKNLTLRLLRAVKNRFGPTDEVGIFSMEDKGLISMGNPEKLFLSKTKKAVAGSVITSVMQGTRPVLIEIQALTNPTKLAYPRRVAQGIDTKRLELLLAVLSRRCGVPVHDYDCFVNVAGGISVKNDPSVDLAVCLAIASSFYDKTLSGLIVVIGEVGLLGDIREVVALERRVKEAGRLGYKKAITNKQVGYLGQAIKRYLK